MIRSSCGFIPSIVADIIILLCIIKEKISPATKEKANKEILNLPPTIFLENGRELN
jgi:hypothetical protein